MFEKKKEEFISEDHELTKKVFEFPWAMMFEDLPQGGIFVKLFPYIATILLVIIAVIAAIK